MTVKEIRLDALPPKSGNILETLLYGGELPRSVLTANGARHCAWFSPAALAARWMPDCFLRKPFRWKV